MTFTAASRLGTERKQPEMSCRKVPGKWKTILKKQKINVHDLLGQFVNITVDGKSSRRKIKINIWFA